jgi:hypothetical protein
MGTNLGHGLSLRNNCAIPSFTWISLGGTVSENMNFLRHDCASLPHTLRQLSV